MANILITGSTGYIGSRLIEALRHSDHQLRCTARKTTYLNNTLPPNATAIEADFSHPSLDIAPAVKDCELAFFLMHSLGESARFEKTEADIAQSFADMARQANIKKIIYLGGLVDEALSRHSPHMKSRLQVGNILRSSGIPTLEFRASIILGPGSLSFDLIRALVERLPIMVTPKWIHVHAQPIYIDDVIAYLIEAIDQSVDRSEIVEIGGADIRSYKNIMEDYAEIRGLRRVMIPVPFLTPKLSGLWLGLVTPLYARVGRKLIDSISHESTVKHPGPARRFNVKPLRCKDAIEKCLEKEDRESTVNPWYWATSSSTTPAPKSGIKYGNRIIETYRIKVPTTAKNPFKPIEEIGGDTGWYYLNGLWKLRAMIDILWGGVGLRRGRPKNRAIQVGDPIDWWRVEAFQPGRHLRLKAEMKLPGQAWLDFAYDPHTHTLTQTVTYDPKGLTGLLYWYTLLPLHHKIFNGMLNQIQARQT